MLPSDAVSGLLRYSDRVCPPEETMIRVTPLLAEYGVTRLARITGLDRIGIPVWNAIRPNARSIAIHQGKGVTDIDAKVSATMEALERAVAEQPRIPFKSASRKQLDCGGLESDSLECLIAAGEQQAASDAALDWVEGRDLITGQAIWVPRDAVTLDRTLPSRYWQSSDGLASGNTMEEAIFHGLLERIERDAEVLWLLGGQRERAATCIDPKSFGDPVVERLMERIEDADFGIQLFNLTGDVGIPVFYALLTPSGKSGVKPQRYTDVTLGSGAHPIAVRGAIRAITEAVQSRLTLISGARDDVPPEIYARALPDTIKRNLASSPKRWAKKDLCPPSADLSTMLGLVIDKLVARKVTRVIIVRLNPEDDRLAVVKVLVPGLENPEGFRRQPFGPRALAKMLVFR